jgi:hypothetical protein
MKHFKPEEYRANRSYRRKVKGDKLFTFFLSKVSTLEPFDEDKRPWKRNNKVNADGAELYETTAIIDFVLPSGIIVRIPSGFEWDGASIPKFAQWIIGKPMGKYALAALLHDWFYSSLVLGSKGRKEADEYFLMAMECLNIAWWRRKSMYRAVRFGGGGPYKNKANITHCKEIFSGVNKYNPWKDYNNHFIKAK